MLVLTLMFPYFTPTERVRAAENADVTDQLEEIRDTFNDIPADETEDFETVDIDTRNIIHKPQVYKPLKRKAITPPNASYSITPGTGGVSRDFQDGEHSFLVSAIEDQDLWIKGNLVGQREHVNIWVLDDDDYHANPSTPPHGPTCHLKDINGGIAENIADKLESIYESMTGSNGFGQHAGVVIDPKCFPGVIDAVGDVDRDGRVNFLLYDLYANNPGSTYVAGFFAPYDFLTTDPNNSKTMNALDMLHIDIGDGQGYNSIKDGASTADQLKFSGTLAHEFQHMLFFMYFGVYLLGTQVDVQSQYQWLNESLSELAATYFAEDGVVAADTSRLKNAVKNAYIPPSGFSGYGDFLNFNNSLKNYGMGRLFSMLMYKKFGDEYIKGIYDELNNKFPQPANSAIAGGYIDTINNVGYEKIIGNLLYRSFGEKVGASPDDALLRMTYYLFMENFAADGGLSFSDAESLPTETVKFHTEKSKNDNLWGIRPTDTGLAALPTAILGQDTVGTIKLEGYNWSTTHPAATHEMLYRLGAGGGDTPVLNVTPNDGNNATLYYAVIPNDDISTETSINYGELGADVHLLKSGALNKVNAYGKPAYLYVVTYGRDVNSTVTYSWGGPDPDELSGSVTLDNVSPRFNDVIHATVDANAPPDTYIWTSGGKALTGAITDESGSSYQVKESDIGNTIMVTVKAAGYSGELSAHTAAVMKALYSGDPVEPPRPSDVSYSSVTLERFNGYEYSNGGLLWQDDCAFADLQPESTYDFYQRVKATSTHEASPRSEKLTLTTGPVPTAITVNPSAVSAQKGSVVDFKAYMNETTDELVKWSVYGGVTGTYMSPEITSGSSLYINEDETTSRLYINADETASKLIVKAVSVSDGAQYATAAVTILQAPPITPEETVSPTPTPTVTVQPTHGLTYQPTPAQGPANQPTPTEYPFPGLKPQYSSAGTPGGPQYAAPQNNAQASPAQASPGDHYTQTGENVSFNLTPAKISELADSKGMVNLDASGLKGVTNATVPFTALHAVAQAGMGVELSLPQGKISLGKSAAMNIAKLALGGDITLSLKAAGSASLNPAQKSAAGNGAVYEISLSDSKKTIKNINAPVEIKLPYKLAPGENPDHMVVYNIGEDGAKKIMKNSGFDASTNSMAFTTTHFSLFAAQENPVFFSDISGHWAQSPIMKSGARHLISGYGNGTFKPDNSVTRAEFTQLLYHALDLPDRGGAAAPYTDVDTNKWYNKAIVSAKQAGILNGLASANGAFMPDAPISRRDMALMLANAADVKNINAVTDIGISKFADKNLIGENYAWAVERAVNAGLLSEEGMGGGSFGPMSYTSRAQAAVIQDNLVRRLGSLE